MSNLLLIGMPAAGKTTFALYAKGRTQPSVYSQTGVETYGWGLGTHILDTGGGNGNDGKYDNWIKEADKVLFFFNGLEFLNEIENYNDGGPIGAKILCLVWNSIITNRLNADKLFFIATHDDEFSNFRNCYLQGKTEQEFINEYGQRNVDGQIIVNMRSAILKKITLANEEYKYGTRFPYANFMNKSHFFCIDTRERKQSESVYSQINRYRL